MENPKSLVLITVDCLRADHVSFMGYDRPTTPFLDSIAKQGLVIPSAIVAGTPTYYSFPAIFASRYPLSLGRDLLGIAPKEPTLASVLKGQGYATAGFVAANPYLTRAFGYEQGFDVFKDYISGEPGPLTSGSTPAGVSGGSWLSRLNQRLESNAGRIGAAGRLYHELYFQYCQRWAAPKPRSLSALRRFPLADAVVSEALDWLNTVRNERFFLWIHLMDPHSPYYPADDALTMIGRSAPTPFQARYLNDSWNRSDLSALRASRYREDVIALYDAGVRWVDAQLAHLVERMKQAGRWEDSLFALTADHGEEFLDHGGRYHPPSGLMEELIHVPLLLRVPGTQSRRVTNSAFSLLHLAPTLLDAMSALPSESFRGTSHWKEIRDGSSWGEPAVVECVQGCTNPFRMRNRLGPRILAVRDKRYKLMLYFDPPAEVLYDLAEDPHEKSPLPSTAEKQVRGRLLDRALAHLQSLSAGRDPETQLRSRIRDLQLEWAHSA
jgi:arylsulfatase A-like enzyme